MVSSKHGDFSVLHELLLICFLLTDSLRHLRINADR